MNKKTLSLLAAASIALFSACSNIVESTDSQSSVSVFVTNAITGGAVAGATVKLVSSGEIKATDANGLARFGGVSGGSQSLRIDASNYASATKDVYLDASPSVANETSTTISLYPIVTLIGSAYYEDEDRNLQPAEGATIRIELSSSSNLVNKTLETEVGADGKYTFNVPAINLSRVYGLEYKSGDVIYATTSSKNPVLSFGATPTVGDIVYDTKARTNDFRLLGSNTIIYPPTSDSSQVITLNFTDSIDIAKSGRINVLSGGNALAADVTYSEDNKTVTISPLGKWPGDFTISFGTLYSGQGAIISSGTITVRYEEKPAPLEGEVTGVKKTTGTIVTVSGTSASASITWDAKKDATNYRIFGMSTLSKANKSYILLGTFNDAAYCDTDANGKRTCTASVTLSGYALGVLDTDGIPESPFAGDGKVNIVVQAYNDFNQKNSAVFTLTAP